MDLLLLKLLFRHRRLYYTFGLHAKGGMSEKNVILFTKRYDISKNIRKDGLNVNARQTNT